MSEAHIRRQARRGVLLGDVAHLDIDRVKVLPEERYGSAGVFNEGQGVFSRGTISGEDTSYSHLHRLHTDTIVMRKLTGWEGSIAVVGPDHAGMYVSTEFPTFRISTDRLLPRYMALLCQWPVFWEEMKVRATGTVQRRKRVNPDALLSIPVDLPPLEEQRRIVDLMAAADAYGKVIRRVSAATWEAVTALLSEHDAEVTGAVVEAGSLLASSIGGVWGENPGVLDQDVRVVRSTEFTNAGDLVGEGVLRSITGRQLESRELRPDDILLEKSGGGPKQPVGRVVWVGDTRGRTVCANFVQLVRPDSAAVNPRYLFLRMWHWHVAGRTLEFQSQTTGIRNLRTKDYLAQELVLPTRTAQDVLVGEADALLGLAQALARCGDAVAATRSALLGDLLSGEHEIPESYDELLEAV